jgi:hypothetical protein
MDHKTMEGYSRTAQDIENTPSLACQRCGGILVGEHCMDIGDRFWGMRCIQCGDVIDETILRNRFASIETLTLTLLNKSHKRRNA